MGVQTNTAHFDQLSVGPINGSCFFVDRFEHQFPEEVVRRAAEKMGACFERYNKLRLWVLRVQLQTKETLNLRLREDVFVPTPNAELLLRAVEEESPGKRVLDIGSGTGLFALAAAKSGAVESVGVEVGESGLRLAKKNAKLNNLSNARFISPTELENERSFDLVAINLPQTPTESYCGRTGNKLVIEYLENLPKYMNEGAGILLSVVSYAAPENTFEFCSKNFEQIEIQASQFIQLPEYFDESTVLRTFGEGTGKFYTSEGELITEEQEIKQGFANRSLFSKNLTVRLGKPI